MGLRAFESYFLSERPLASKLDPTDHRLLDLLRDDARLSYAELGRQVGLTAPAVAERMR
ncbi:MAG: AsnC family protein, partial [Caldilineaceae bacterium]|nr:AsnC family protein [Caldilineaceae bacterium]